MARTAETAENRRTRLVTIARGVIAEEGVSACTFRTLAKAAGTSTRPFTHAFGTRDALLRAVALTTWDNNGLGARTVITEIDRPDYWNCIDEVTSMGEAWLPLSDERARGERIYLEIVLYSLSHPLLEKELLSFSDASNAHMAAIFAEGQRRRQVRTDRTVEELVMAFWSYAEGLSFSAVYETKALPRDMMLGLWRDGIRRLLEP
jgi:AcrR family transcriptional regulator